MAAASLKDPSAMSIDQQSANTTAAPVFGRALHSSAAIKISHKNPPLSEDINLDAGYYVHSQKLGEGGFGKVRLATHLVAKEKVAIKFMEKAKVGKDLPRIYNEIECLKTLDHENIAQLYQVIETEEYIILILEYCPGGELFDYIINRRRLGDHEAKTIMRSLLLVLKYLHGKGIAHRDLKPENILLDNRRNIKLIDFGLAANTNIMKTDMSHLQTCCGSLAYAAPELIQGKEYNGSAADVWSAGIILYILLVGALPFDEPDQSKLCKLITTGVFKIPAHVSPWARDLLPRMLNIDPKRRISVDDILRHQWMHSTTISSQQASTLKRLEEMSSQPKKIDNALLWELVNHFNGMQLLELRDRVLNDYGYARAAYWLMHGKKSRSTSRIPPSMQALTDSGRETQKRRSRSQSDLPKFDVDLTPSKQQKQTPSVQHQPPAVVAQNNCNRPDQPHIPAGSKRKAVHNPSQDGSLSPVARKIPPPPLDTRYLIRAANDTLSSNASKGVTPAASRIPPRRQVMHTEAKPSIVGTTRAHDSHNGTLRSKGMAVNGLPVGVTPSRRPTASAAASSVRSPLRQSHNVTTNSPLNRNLFATEKLSSGKDDSKISKMSDASTPSGKLTATDLATPKKNILKRFLASATPARSSGPRIIQVTGENITMTRYTDPSELMRTIKTSLERKGFEVKVKDNYTLRCMLIQKYGGRVLTFDLEIVRYNTTVGLTASGVKTFKCAIQRKRLLGDSFHYKKVCEELLRIANTVSMDDSLFGC